MPLLKSEAPLVGTGIERKAALDSGAVILANEEGIVSKVTGDSIVVERDGGEKDVYKLAKFERSNQGPVSTKSPWSAKVRSGQGHIDSRRASTDQGSWPVNVLVAFTLGGPII